MAKAPPLYVVKRIPAPGYPGRFYYEVWYQGMEWLKGSSQPLRLRTARQIRDMLNTRDKEGTL